ncbi:MAG TPA: hypothetical protein VGG65_09275, partial [Thermoanaerobaculia bacterium]
PLHFIFAFSIFGLLLVSDARSITGVPTAGPAPEAAIAGTAPLCVADVHTLCLNDNRFSVTATFQQTPEGPSAPATAVPLTGDSGYFWFFDAANVELITKVLNGCGVTDSYWFFASGLTNVGVHIVVTDLRSGVFQSYDNAVGTPFAPIQDTSAFSACH